MNLKKLMTLSAAITVLLLLPIGAVWSQSPAPQANDFVVRNVRIFDGVRVIDGTGETLLPGLIDSHTHVFGNALKDALIFGVTTELDMFTDYKYAAQTKKEQAEGKDLDLADLRSAGTLVTAPNGHGTEYGIPIPTISSPDEAQAFVDARIAEGSDYIKIIYDDGKVYGTTIPTLSKETMAAVVAAAHKRGKMAVAHIGSLQGARDAIAAGVDGLMHLFVDSAPDPKFAAFVAQHHAFVVPTLSVLASITHTPAGKSLAADSRLAPYLSPDASSNLTRAFPRKGGDFAFAQETIRQLKAYHVPILAGTDAPNPGTTHGASMHEELELLVGSGLTPVEALTAATSAPAAAFHLPDRGQIAPGKRADLLLVKGDPTTDIKATRHIVSVWKLGVEDDRASYRAAVEKAKQAAEAQKQAPPPPGSESGLISDFDDGTLNTKFGSGWQVSTDSYMGGKSTAQMHVVEGGAEGSKDALQIEGEIVSNSIVWAGAMFFPGPHPMAPVNLSGKKSISFWTKGDGAKYSVLVYSQSNGYIPASQTFVAGPEWKKFTMPLADFHTDGHDLMAIFFGAASAPGHFKFMIDNVRLD